MPSQATHVAVNVGNRPRPQLAANGPGNCPPTARAGAPPARRSPCVPRDGEAAPEQLVGWDPPALAYALHTPLIMCTYDLSSSATVRSGTLQPWPMPSTHPSSTVQTAAWCAPQVRPHTHRPTRRRRALVPRVGAPCVAPSSGRLLSVPPRPARPASRPASLAHLAAEPNSPLVRAGRLQFPCSARYAKPCSPLPRSPQARHPGQLGGGGGGGRAGGLFHGPHLGHRAARRHAVSRGGAGMHTTNMWTPANSPGAGEGCCHVPWRAPWVAEIEPPSAEPCLQASA